MGRKRMRIVFCVGSMEQGGAGRVVANLSSELAKKNEVSLIITKNEKIGYPLDKRVGRFILDKQGQRSSFFGRNLIRIRKMYKIFKKESPDIVISFLPESSYRLMMIKPFFSFKTIISVRNDPNVEYNTFLKRVFTKALYSMADGFVFQTPDAKKWFSRKIQNRAMVIPNPINEKFICSPYEGERKKVITNVSRLVVQKKHEILIDAFADFYKSHNDYCFEIYGDGPRRGIIQKYITEKGLEKSVKLMGKISDIKDKIYNSSMFVIASEYEGMPNALMEAMALGIPCISTDCPIGGPKFLIKDGENGLLVKVGDRDGIRNAMDRLANDSKLSRTISLNASKSSAQFALKNISRIWENYIVKLLGEEERV